MKSPFAIFRENQKIAMIFLTLMAMFAFVFLDTTTRRGMGRGARQGEMVVKLKTGNLDNFAVQQLINRRVRANDFIRQAFSRSIDMSKLNQGQLGQLQGRLQSLMFQFGQPSMAQDVLMGYLFRLEAQKMGLIVTDEAIGGFIDEVTDNRLGTERFRRIVTEMHMSAKELYDVLRDELQARLAYAMQRPADAQSPDEYWKFFKQIKVEQSIEVAAVPLSEFLPQISDPSDSELKKFFEAHKKTVSEGESGYKPGFKQPRRVKLQALEASYEAAEKKVPEVTDEEVTAYYEKHKDELYLNFDSTPNDSKPIEPGFAPEQTEGATDSGAKPAEGESKEKASPPDGENKSGTEQGGQSGDEKSGEKGKEQGSLPLAPSPDRNLVARRVLREALRQTPAGEESLALALLDESEATKAASDKPDAKSEAKSPEAANKAPQETPATSDGEKKDAAAQPGTDAQGKDASPENANNEKKADGKPGEAKKGESAYRPLDDTLKDEIRERLLRERTMVELKEKFGGEALNKLTSLAVKYNIPPAMDGPNLFVDFNGDQKWEPKTEPGYKPTDKVNVERLTPAQTRRLQEEMAKFAEAEVKQVASELGMQFSETPLASPLELSKLPGIGGAVEANDQAAGPMSTASIVEQVFSDESVYRPMLAVDPLTQNLYAYWKIEDIPTHVPEYAEAGVKEQVLSTWKKEQARPLAEKRAEELAKKVNESKKSMSEALVAQTLMEGGPALTVQTTPNFSWMRELTAPSQNPFAPKPPPELSPVHYVTNIGNEFMEVVFDRLKPGEAGVAPNADRSTYYVVQVEQRTPSTPEQMEELRNTFLKSDLFGFSFGGFRMSTPYQTLAEMKQGQTIRDWMKGLEKKYDVEWVVGDFSGKYGIAEMD